MASIDVTNSGTAPQPAAVVHPTAERIPALDGIRGFAALSVMLYHLFGAGPSGGRLVHFVQSVLGAGWTGVDLFFTLSGFLITGILYDSLDSSTFFRSFYARRILRIFPLYYLVVFTAIALPRPLHLQWNGIQWVFLAYLQNNLSVLIHRPYNIKTIEHFWTLALEEQFYLAWPLLIYLCRTRRATRLLLGGSLLLCLAVLCGRIALVRAGASEGLLDSSTFCRVDALLLGSSVAIAGRIGWLQRLQRAAIPVFVLCLTALLAIFVVRGGFHNGDAWVHSFGFTILDLFFCSLIVLATRRQGRLAGAFSAGWLRWLGTYSYGLYVYHEILSNLFSSAIRDRVDVHAPKIVGVLASATIIGGTSVLIAYASFQLYEQRFNRLKRHFPYRPPRVPLARA